MDLFGLDRGKRIEEVDVRTHYHALALEVDGERVKVAVFPEESKASVESCVVDKATLIVGKVGIRSLGSVREDKGDVPHEGNVVMPNGEEAFFDVRVAGLRNLRGKPAADTIGRSSEYKVV